jgi:hypothetical protein
MDNLGRTFDKQLSRVKLSHRLLDLEKRISDLWLVSNFHELHTDDLNATNIDLLLKEALHATADDSRVGDKARLFGRVEIKLATYASDDLQALVLNIIIRVFHTVTEGNGILNPVVDDAGNRERRSAFIRH